jgi:hypothetical protein
MNQPYSAPPPCAPPPRKGDAEQLDLLAMLFYAYAAFVGFGALVFGGVALMGLAAVLAQQRQPAEAAPQILGVVFLIVFAAAALLFAAKVVVMVLAGSAIRRRTGYVLAMVGACMALINFPIGTALGIFAIITLQKPAVKALLGSD